MEEIYRFNYEIKCPYCRCYIAPVLMEDEESGRIILICPACKTELSIKDLEEDDEKDSED